MKLKVSKETNNYIQFYSGVDSKSKAKYGVMLMTKKELKSTINNYYFWNERIIQIRLKLSRGYMTVIGVYAPVEGEDEENDQFYTKLQRIVKKVNRSDMQVLTGDFSARVGNVKIEHCMGVHGEQTCNRNGNRLIYLLVYNQLKIMNILFDHEDSHEFTWEARNLKSIIDYIICNNKIANMVLDTRVFRGPEIESDHYLLVSSIRIKPRWHRKKKNTNQPQELSHRVSLFKESSIIWLYQKRLDTIIKETPIQNNVEDEWNALQNILKQATKKSLGTKRKWSRKKGLRTWDDNIAKVISDKREAYKKYLSTKEIEYKIEYHRKRAIAKREVRKIHRHNWEEFVAYLENDLYRPQPQTYKILKNLSNEMRENIKNVGWGGVEWDVIVWDGLGWDGIECGVGWSGVGCDSMGWVGMGWDRMWSGVEWDMIVWDGVGGWGGMGWDGMGWDGMDGMGWAGLK
ncbi:hypothetical protein ANN_08465 [Periplaneta americana]|uniref:Endonuclease/exonuclease/phosphatase domain-containing protein n=1 Tax=Periplaneta americana TaxID=6978 RepID=A0ABQ8T2W4_PERAM|nr:hypothetical protein ANN_08465 [Periplaneta americana]